MNFKYKCTRGLEIYHCNLLNYMECLVEYIELDSNIYELPQLVSDESSQKIDNLFDEIKYTYQDIILYKNKQWTKKEYEEFVSEYLIIDDYDNNSIITRIDLIHWFEKII